MGSSPSILLAGALADLPRWRGVLRDLTRTPDVIFDRFDPLPALFQVRMALFFAGISRRKGIGLTAATTDDIEWNGEP